ncbi:MAG: hypothetical protein JWN31_1662, partial [Frankiales bacterium]|nr:hypothetical protein [Frankiales bacterium]
MASGAPDQLVYLSNRPAVLAETLGYVRHFMPWVREAVVLTPAASLPELRSATAAVEGIDVVLVDETTVLSAAEQSSLSALHHGDRNTLLRRALLSRGPVDDVFLQSDDDYRPLKPIEADVFASDGRIVPYACHDLALYWRNESPFDRVQHVSYLVLSYLGAEHLCFASHMPQAIDKALALEAFAVAEKLTGGTEFDEWSLPINYGRLLAPERYAEPRTFRTMCWPQYPHEWPYWRRPEDLSFENFYPELYAKGRLF